VLVRRIAAGRQAGDRLRGADQASRFDAAIYLPGDEQVVLVEKGFPDLKPKGGKRNIDATAGERLLDCAGRVAELPAANLKGVEVLVAPAESDLQHGVELGERSLLTDPNPARHRR
jgi:hypothetical protein